VLRDSKMRKRSKSVYTQRDAGFANKRKPRKSQTICAYKSNIKTSLFSEAYSDTEDQEHDDEQDELSAANASNWSMDEKIELLRQVDEQIPKIDLSYSRTLSKMDWTKFEVGTHSAEDIKAQVHWLIKPVRKIRSLREVIGDCNSASLQKSHEDMPKRPMTAYNLFFKEKFHKVKEKLGNESAVSQLFGSHLGTC